MVSKRAIGIACLGLALGCAGLGPSSGRLKTLQLDDDMKKPTPKKKGEVADEPNKYVMRIASRGAVFEFEMPAHASSYEMRVPLATGGSGEMLTPADQELLADQLGGGDNAKVDAKAAAKRPSYLSAVARVNQMYAEKQFELALIEVVNLEKTYPKDARLQAMKGSLYAKLGKDKLAKDAWEKALALNPTDLGVAEALRELSERQGVTQ